ncbi:FAD:protein FMN transferase [Andreprevotia lacus]|uniref:FAD:protein FMN transferase n=1 Tax=Andreprevotia lacus TaxID=1121000 RepID=UPI00111BE399|nr:FAD:protein FMN transferase [Andreprevotia lacus]
MRRAYRRPGSALRTALCLGAVLLLGACNREPLYQRDAPAFGQRMQLALWGLQPDVAAQQADAVLAEVARAESKLGNGPKSALSAANAVLARGEPAALDDELREALQLAAALEQRSDGLFTPAGPRRAVAASDASAVEAVPPVGPARLAEQQFDGNTLSGDVAGAIRLDGFSHGWALDRSAATLRRHRAFNALLQLGDVALAQGKRGEAPWRVALPDPSGGTLAMLALKPGEALGLAGVSPVIDPRSGQAAHKTRLTVVLTPPSLQAATLAQVAARTAFIGGREETMLYSGNYGSREALVIATDGSIYVTPGLQQRLEWKKKPSHLYRLR